MNKYNIYEFDYTYNKTQTSMKGSLIELPVDVDKTTAIVEDFNVYDFNVSLSEANKLDQKLVRIRRYTGLPSWHSG